MNPHPTKSKPCKIGRKHTGAPGVRRLGRITSNTIKKHKQAVSRIRSFKAKVAAFWRGEIDVYPSLP